MALERTSQYLSAFHSRTHPAIFNRPLTFLRGIWQGGTCPLPIVLMRLSAPKREYQPIAVFTAHNSMAKAPIVSA